MPATPAKCERGGAGWSAEDKNRLLIAIIEQFTAGDKQMSIDWNKIDVPGRSNKAMSLQWYKIKNEAKKNAAARDGTDGVSEPATPSKKTPSKVQKTPRKTPGKRTATKEFDNDLDTDTRSPAKTVKVKTETDDGSVFAAPQPQAGVVPIPYPYSEVHFDPDGYV